MPPRTEEADDGRAEQGDDGLCASWAMESDSVLIDLCHRVCYVDCWCEGEASSTLMCHPLPYPAFQLRTLHPPHSASLPSHSTAQRVTTRWPS